MKASDWDLTLHVEDRVTIARPIEDVFMFAGDPANDSGWRSDVLVSRRTSAGPVDAGTTFTWVMNAALGKTREMEGKIDEYEPPHRLRFLCTGTGAPVITYLLETEGPMTRFTRAVAVQCGPRFMAPVIKELVKRRNARYVAKLKELLERPPVEE